MRAMPGDLIHQLIVIGCGVFYYCATTIRLCNAAEKLICSFFARLPDYRQSVFQEVLTGIHNIPHKKSKRKEFMSEGEKLTVWTKFFLRLFQCTCNPFAYGFDDEKVTQPQIEEMWTELNRLMTQFVHKFLKTLFKPSSKSRALPDEAKELLEVTLLEVLQAAYSSPDFPIAILMLETFSKLLRYFASKKDFDSTVRDLSCKMMAHCAARWNLEVLKIHFASV